MTERAGSPRWIDWDLAVRLGRRVAGDAQSAFDPASARAASDEALEAALSYTTLSVDAPLPPLEIVSRAEWIEPNAAELAKLMARVEERAGSELNLPGPLGPVARRAVGAAAGAEAGAVLGYAAKRVLGQYQVSLRADPSEPRLLLVGANLTEATRRLGVDERSFLRWVLIHEWTHAIQFGAVAWLRPHLSGLVSELLGAAAGDLDLRGILARARSLVIPDPREGIRRILNGELARIFAGEEQGHVMDRVSAVMAVVEGYAEHVMDAASAGEPELELMRDRMDARRAQRTGLVDAIARVLGLGAKLRQYEVGKRWCDAVAADAGIEGLDRVWQNPDALPSLAELDDPPAWIERVLTPAAA